MNNINGEFVSIGGKDFYRIDNYDRLDPFLFTIASSNDIWFYLSSNGGVTAGRQSAEYAYFPYLTEDRMCHSTDTGAKTLIKVNRNGAVKLWQPFTESLINPYEVERSIFKSVLGDEVIFEEHNLTLDLTFGYHWQSCDKYGIVRTAYLQCGTQDADAELIDGILNILPYGIRSAFQLEWPCLGDAYKSSEIVGDHTAVFALTSAINDMPEPEEMLKCNIAWYDADFDCDICLSEKALDGFVRGNIEKSDINLGDRGCFLLNFKLSLKSGERKQWRTVSDVGLSQEEVSVIARGIPSSDLDAALAASEHELRSIIAKADGLQCTGNRMASVHHMSNVMFNNMRGGLFLHGYGIDTADFIDFVKTRNSVFYNENTDLIDRVTDGVKTIGQLKERARETGNKNLIRLSLEYLPISFSRRHGDPSRPWNKFSIVLKNEDGTPRTNYEGNWRDIFQNWEAMCLSFPGYIDSVIAAFLDASTADGYNPYRITRDGIDWEVAEPGNPNSSQGYWGDHQIIYLSRLIQWLGKYDTEALKRLIACDSFSYADVPYEIAQFDKMLENPKDTIFLNAEKNRVLRENSAKFGGDYRLLIKDGKIYTAAFAEKLIIPIASKISNLIVGGGVWMNTRRPEWNDANNAIVGYGLSVVTACHLRRHLSLCLRMFEQYGNETFEISNEVGTWLSDIRSVMEKYCASVESGAVDGKLRMNFARDMGYAFDRYKTVVYGDGFTGKTVFSYDDLCKFIELALVFTDYTVRANRRSDGFYHSYNLLERSGDGIGVKNLFLMLEGQVAVLGCGILDGSEAAELLENMKNSELYSERDDSFYLYPVRMTARFMERNIVPESFVSGSALVKKLIAHGNRDLFVKDAFGNIRFAPEITFEPKLRAALEKLCADPELETEASLEASAVIKIFEEMFRHFEFTGRSQIMYKYEGIGSIYWHQNSKLLVSAQESYFDALSHGDKADAERLGKQYYSVRAGLGFYKSPSVWGAFPQDAYSHTPFGGGAKQPGMTGQVKEEIITRFGELGVIPENGCIRFDTSIVRENEYLDAPAKFEFIRESGESEYIELDSGSFDFSFCQTPVIYIKSGSADSHTSAITVSYRDGSTAGIKSGILPSDISAEIFGRSGKIDRVTVLA